MDEESRQKKTTELGRLSVEEATLKDPFRDVRGHKVYDRGGEQVGKVEDLYVDREGEARFLNVSSGGGLLGSPKRHFIIPFEKISDVKGSEGVVLALDFEKIKKSPLFDQAEAPDEAQQRAIYAYYEG
ncbi:MAG: PRC-barrel domain-containing protein [Rubrobacteraceae bacterium]|uniref:PRC-barrel domain-containing protein n=1 Tax=Rubrobacter naiadicus TaxID=1392641 RepID=UPI0023626527|nr:PRC-barrel domain-containing protein [Rubrobacter naiadicus]MBX6764493.1 PRC-barrel domain-containing protein [Rubrobacteraceae bacterium]MCL6439415.1 PRC-barrel domain-containing protein [Rubrobacteraceae bacterium]